MFTTILAATAMMLMHSVSGQICTVGTYAGDSSGSGFSGDGGDATRAKMNLVTTGGVWVDTSMKMFIGDLSNNRVRAVNPDTKIISTIAG